MPIPASSMRAVGVLFDGVRPLVNRLWDRLACDTHQAHTYQARLPPYVYRHRHSHAKNLFFEERHHAPVPRHPDEVDVLSLRKPKHKKDPVGGRGVGGTIGGGGVLRLSLYADYVESCHGSGDTESCLA